MKPFLINRDGTLPENMTIEKAEAYGLTLVIPTDQPEARPGYNIVDGHYINDGVNIYQGWLYNPIPTLDLSNVTLPDLTPTQFIYLLAVTGLEDIWDELEVSAKATNRKLYATLKASRNSATYRFQETLDMIQVFSPYLPETAPSLSREVLEPLWIDASTFTIEGTQT